MTKIIKKMYNHFPRPIEQATNNEMKKARKTDWRGWGISTGKLQPYSKILDLDEKVFTEKTL
jgi:hypothetical protein